MKNLNKYISIFLLGAFAILAPLEVMSQSQQVKPPTKPPGGHKPGTGQGSGGTKPPGGNKPGTGQGSGGTNKPGTKPPTVPSPPTPVKEINNGVAYFLPGGSEMVVLFDRGSNYSLNATQKKELKNMSDIILANPDYEFDVVGTDPNFTGSYDENLRAAQNRANTVKGFLMSCGVDDSQLQVSIDWDLNEELFGNLPISSQRPAVKISMGNERNNGRTIGYSNPTGEINGHSYVDLGLSVRWAYSNVGASSPKSIGGYYSWKQATLNLNWGGAWRVPSKAECEELLRKCKWHWEDLGDIKGFKVTGPNGRSIFLPAGGSVNYGSSSPFLVGSYGYYWTTTVHSSNETSYCLNFNMDKPSVDPNDIRDGLLIRPVAP